MSDFKMARMYVEARMYIPCSLFYDVNIFYIHISCILHSKLDTVSSFS